MVEELLKMLVRGILIGVVVSAPMGPVGIFCIQRTLDKGRLSGFFTGVGASISDLIYCILTGFCLSFIEEFINVHRGPIQIFGASVLIGFGIWLVKKKPDSTSVPGADQGSPSVEGDILKGFALTFSNPLILFLIIGLFAQFNFVVAGMTFWHYILGFLGIISGALAWWWTVTFFVDKLRGHFNQRTMKMINTVVGVIILSFAVFGIVSATSAYAQGAIYNPKMSVDASFRVADKSMKGWRAEITDSAGNGFNLKVIPVLLQDPFGDTDRNALSVTIEDSKSGAVIATSSFYDGLDTYKGKNSWRLLRNGTNWNLYAGNREYRHRVHFEAEMGHACLPRIVANGDADIELMTYVADKDFEGDMICGRVADVLTYMVEPGDRISGVYSLFDYEQDDSYAKLGGQYRVALLPADDKGFDIVYVDGAKVYSDVWREGMRKGKLLSTPFANIYNVEWVDAEGMAMLHDIKADYDLLTHILTIRFPYQNSVIRFKKESPSP